MAKNKTITVRLFCSDCGHHFQYEIPEGTVVFDGNARDSEDDVIAVFNCPVCESSEVNCIDL